MADQKPLHCSFCGKTQFEIKKLVAGPRVFICNECVDLCADIINEENRIKDAKEVLRANGYIIHDPVPQNKVSEAKKVLEDLGYKLEEPPSPESSLDRFERFFGGK